MAARYKLAGMMRTTINDVRILALDDLQSIELSIQAIQDCDNDNFDRLEYILGTLWDDDSAKSVNEVGSAGEAQSRSFNSKQLRMPLALSIKPEILKIIRDHFSSKKMDHVPSEAKSMFDLPKEQFLAKMGRGASVYQATGVKRDENQNHTFTAGPTRPLGG